MDEQDEELIMGEDSSISWTEHTFNPWVGCTKISPACDHCYAERDNKRYRYVPGWGAGVPRHRTTASWENPPRWNRRAALTGVRPRVFCASLADIFDNEVDPSWRVDLWSLIRATPNIHWMLLTKRIGNAEKMLPPDWPYPHVGLMATLENQEVFDRDWPKLARIPAAWRGISIEPMLSPILIGAARPDWVIVGGESGPGHRELPVAWAQSVRDQCAALQIPFHFKQWSGRTSKAAGCELDGREHKAFPAAHEDKQRVV
jgi:protein gp37